MLVDFIRGKAYVSFLVALVPVLIFGMEETSRKGDREKEEEFPRKRVREEKEEAEKQPSRKKHKQFSQEEIAVASSALVGALETYDLIAARQALDNGAIINYDSESSLLTSAMQSYSESPRKNQEVELETIRFLIAHGAACDSAEIRNAVDFYLPSEILVAMIRHGAPFNDDLLDVGVNPAEEIEDFDRELNHAMRIEMLLWLLLRVTLKNNQMNGLAKIVSCDALVCFSGIPMTISERFGPLLRTLLLGTRDGAKDIIEDLARLSELRRDEIRSLNEALVFAAAHNDLEIVAMILEKLKRHIRQESIHEALEAAALRGQLDAFKALLSSGLLSAESNHALENALLTEASQKNEDILSFILGIDGTCDFHLNIFSLAVQLDRLSRYEGISEQLKDSYLRSRNMLAAVIVSRNVERLLLPAQTEEEEEPGSFLHVPTQIINYLMNLARSAGRRICPVQTEEEEEEKQSVNPFLSLPPELIWYLMAFLRPPFHTIER